MSVYMIIDSKIKDGEKYKLDIISDYKFNICFENTIHPGYYTEKLLHAKIAGCIPIYYSDEKMNIDFNEKCALNLYDFENQAICRLYFCENATVFRPFGLVSFLPDRVCIE